VPTRKKAQVLHQQSILTVFPAAASHPKNCLEELAGQVSSLLLSVVQVFVSL
jgi:hypothetical protein